MHHEINEHNSISLDEIDDVTNEIVLIRIEKNVFIYPILNSSCKVHRS